MATLMGQHWITTSDPDDLFGKYTSPVENKIGVFLEEAKLNSAHQEQLRTMVTDKTYRCRALYANTEFVDSYHNLFLCTNDCQRVTLQLSTLLILI